ncbi:MAG: acetyl-coenzyme A synthetase N-terminal domain-containing protein, partial [Candidatus Saccharibacteria bacterium]|nr:acetyl-coenzyme A synthetase N-terminal domain-containing protein [Candidatus Saccharibacteria bacterium]
MSNLFYPNPDFQKHAYINSMDKYNELCAMTRENPDDYWGNLADKYIDWFKPYTQILDESKAPFYS